MLLGVYVVMAMMHGLVLVQGRHGNRSGRNRAAERQWLLCGKECHCNKDLTVIRCDHAGMASTPLNVPVSTRELNLDNNKIFKLDAGFVNESINLKSLSIRHNNLSYIHEEAFSGLVNLRHLALDDNWLENLAPRLFLYCPSLKQLSLANNFLNTRVLSQALPNARRLSVLDVSANDLRGPHFPIANLTHLTQLSLRRINLGNLTSEFFESLASSHLQWLDLSHSTVAGVSAATFRPLTHLTSLDLSYSRIPTQALATIFQGLANNTLGTISLKYSFIEDDPQFVFAPDTFRGLSQSKIKVLRLEGNYFGFARVLGASLLRGVSSLRELYLADSCLVSLAEGSLQGLRKLKRLDLSRNLLQCSDASSCAALFADARFPSLQKLDLSHNSIVTQSKNIRFHGRSFPSLTYLSLTNNSLTRISRTLFSSLSALKILELSHNPLYSIEAFSFKDLTSLQRLEITGCTTLAELQNNTLHGLTNLTHLTLSSNGLRRLAPGALSGAPGLQELHLDNNKLSGDLSSVLVGGGGRLVMVSLADNRLVDIPTEILQSAAVVDLKFNRITGCQNGGLQADSLRVLDLSHNLLTDAQCLKSLTNNNLTLNLAANPFHCHCATASSISLLSTPSWRLQDQQHSLCASPESARGQPFHGFQSSQWECGLGSVVVPVIAGVLSAVSVLTVTAFIVVCSKQGSTSSTADLDSDTTSDEQHTSSSSSRRHKAKHRTKSKTKRKSARSKSSKQLPCRVSEERLIADDDDDVTGQTTCNGRGEDDVEYEMTTTVLNGTTSTHKMDSVVVVHTEDDVGVELVTSTS